MAMPLPAMAGLGSTSDALRLHPRTTPSFAFSHVTVPTPTATSRYSVCDKVTALYPMPATPGAVRCRTVALMARPNAFSSTSAPRASKSLVMPVTYSRISSDYGTRYHPVTRVKHSHTGIDLVAPHGAPVRVVAQGAVKTIGYERRGFGRYIVIDHRDDNETIYAHLSATARGLRVGQTVKAGDVIGAVGKTGMVTGAHLHFELRRQGVPVDPRPLLRRTARAREVHTVTDNGCHNLLDDLVACHSQGRAWATDRWQYSPL
ncbi:M23 family metallopeptidase [Pandoraea communis]|uniref:M23 family metallopeptidase n=1 Tax=Pandoraea communis TaxID=2508297 RepID=UPI0025A6244D|nr:M23 family metallopeptidase [Pandoraea communis]MDM8359131.1 M23 family metallopeptidase [Pandoraea communis]